MLHNKHLHCNHANVLRVSMTCCDIVCCIGLNDYFSDFGSYIFGSLMS